MTVSGELTLFELNTLVRDKLLSALPDRYWICAEVSEARENYSGHCYLELVDKDASTGEMRAKARAIIWATVYRMLKAYFAAETGSNIVPGIKILIQVSVDLHEVYGYTLTVHDIDPRYTLGDMARQRREVLQKLSEEGIIDMNKELSWPQLPQRIAIISSPTAAGYGDFIDQLHHNHYGYRFYTALFIAVMQGTHTEKSIIEALEHIYRQEEAFDGVVIIRGGGATSELNCFDSYELAQNVAQFPLPILAGIGARPRRDGHRPHCQRSGKNADRSSGMVYKPGDGSRSQTGRTANRTFFRSQKAPAKRKAKIIVSRTTITGSHRPASYRRKQLAFPLHAFVAAKYRSTHLRRTSTARPAGRNDTVIISSTHIETRLLTDIERGKSRPLGNRTEKRRPYRYFFR